MPDFSELLSKPTEEIKKPKPLPEGSYQVLISAHKYDEAKTKEGPKAIVRLTCRFQEAMDDVDEADLSDALQGEVLTTKSATYDMWLTPDAQYRVVEFAKSLGVETEGTTLGQIIPEFVNQSAMATVVQVQSNKPGQDDVFFSNITNLVGTAG